MTTPAQQELNENTHKALGRFVVMFSGVLYALETSTVQLMGADGPNRMLAHAVLADRTASPIVASFFSVFHANWGDLLKPGDKKIMSCLRRELDELIRVRNRLMHDAWMGSTVGGDPGPHALSRHRIRAHGAGVEFESARYLPEDLDSLATEAHRLSSIVNACVWYRRDGQIGPELERRMNVLNRKVVRHD